MALNRHYDNGRMAANAIGRHRNNNGLINPRNLRQAWQVGQQGANWIRDQYNNWNRDDGNESHTGLSEKMGNMGNDEGSNVDMNNTNGGSGGGGVAAFRGALVGDSEDSPSYARHYLELAPLHSRKRGQQEIWWAPYIYSNTSLYLITGNTSGWNAGIIGVKNNTGSGDVAGREWNEKTYQYMGTWINPTLAALFNGGAYSGATGTYECFSDDIMPWTYNPQVAEFIDNKMLTQGSSVTFGVAANYAKFRLKSFTIEITPKTYMCNVLALSQSSGASTDVAATSINPSIQHNFAPGAPGALPATNNVAQYDITSPEVNLICSDETDYWFYRDCYNKFCGGNTSTGAPTNGGNVVVDQNQVPVNPSQPVFNCRTIRNLDQFNSCVHSGQTFSFTREVRQKANYFLGIAQLLTLASTPTNMQMFIADLEGLNTDTTLASPALPLYESFNVMAVPTYTPNILTPANVGTGTGI